MATYFPTPKKRFGQNFLNVPYYAERIANSVPALPHEVVAEIGPGVGALTRYLKDLYSNLHCIEMDKEVIPKLKERVGDEGAWQLHISDFMTFDLKLLGKEYHFVGNLPYNVAAHILKKCLFSAPATKSITFMVQREVAERIVASPGGKQIGFLSIFCRYFGVPKILFHVPKGAFIPIPNVESSVFQIVLDETCFNRLDVIYWDPFFLFVSRGFSQRRKKLSNVLVDGKFNRQIWEDIFIKNGIDKNIRAEGLDIQQWIAIFCFYINQLL